MTDHLLAKLICPECQTMVAHVERGEGRSVSVVTRRRQAGAERTRLDRWDLFAGIGQAGLAGIDELMAEHPIFSPPHFPHWPCDHCVREPDGSLVYLQIRRDDMRRILGRSVQAKPLRLTLDSHRVAHRVATIGAET